MTETPCFETEQPQPPKKPENVEEFIVEFIGCFSDSKHIYHRTMDSNVKRSVFELIAKKQQAIKIEEAPNLKGYSLSVKTYE